MSLKLQLANFYKSELELNEWSISCQSEDTIGFSKGEFRIYIHGRQWEDKVDYPRTIHYGLSLDSVTDLLKPVFSAVGQGKCAEPTIYLHCSDYREKMKASGFDASRMSDIDSVKSLIPIMAEALSSQAFPFFERVNDAATLHEYVEKCDRPIWEILPATSDIKLMAIKWFANAPDALDFATKLAETAEHDKANDCRPARKTASRVFELLNSQQWINNPEALLPDAYLNLSGFVINKSYDSIELLQPVFPKIKFGKSKGKTTLKNALCSKEYKPTLYLIPIESGTLFLCHQEHVGYPDFAQSSTFGDIATFRIYDDAKSYSLAFYREGNLKAERVDSHGKLSLIHI